MFRFAVGILSVATALALPASAAAIKAGPGVDYQVTYKGSGTLTESDSDPGEPDLGTQPSSDTGNFSFSWDWKKADDIGFLWLLNHHRQKSTGGGGGQLPGSVSGLVTHHGSKEGAPYSCSDKLGPVGNPGEIHVKSDGKTVDVTPTGTIGPPESGNGCAPLGGRGLTIDAERDLSVSIPLGKLARRKAVIPVSGGTTAPADEETLCAFSGPPFDRCSVDLQFSGTVVVKRICRGRVRANGTFECKR